jgi:ParB/RepB/Spo0J family partition protein
MTDIDTTTESKTAKTPKTPKKGKTAASPADSGAETFQYEFLESTSDTANVSPKDLIFPPFDSRADSANVKLDPNFAADVKVNGVLQPPLVTPVRDKTTGKTGLMIVTGRQRVRAAIEANNAKNKTVLVHVKTMTYQDALIYCGVENIKRKSLTFWDLACYMRSLRDEGGFTQTSIRERLGVSDAMVSQYLAVFDLDERVQKLVRKGDLEPGTNTKVRALKSVTDGDEQYAIALKAAEGGWTSDDIAQSVATLMAKKAMAEKAAKEREKARKSGEGGSTRAAADEEEEGPTFDPKSVAPIKKADLHALLEAVNERIQRMRAKDDIDPEKLAYERGRLDGLKQAGGLKALPKSIAGDE